jgi:two-component system cell cycle response regulator DivK
VARILVVEDSPDNMRLFQAVLGLAGHHVVGLSDGTGLLDTMDRERPELVLMDIQLPECDGFTLLDEIRSSVHRDTPVVALTAHAMSGDAERAIEAGFSGYITKPIDVRSFPGQIRNALLHKAGTEIAEAGGVRDPTTPGAPS